MLPERTVSETNSGRERIASGQGLATRVARRIRPDLAFVALAIPFGAALLVLTPPFQVADEENHFRRSFHLSEGHVIAVKNGDYTGASLPRSLERFYGPFKDVRTHPEQKTTWQQIRDSAAVNCEPGDREFTPFSNTAIHPPLTYVPQAVGIAAARLFSPSVLTYFYAGRVFNFLAATLVTLFAIRLAPVGKWTFVALALTPMALFQSASLSSDALTNSLSFLLVAHVLSCALAPGGLLPFRAVFATAILGAAVGLAKQAYFFLPLCYLLIPVAKLGSPRRYLAGLALVMGATLLAVAGWAFVVRGIYSSPDLSFDINPAQRLREIYATPAHFLGVLGRSALHAPTYAKEYLGYLGWIDTELPLSIYLGELALLLVVFLSDFGARCGLSTRQAAIAAGVAALVTLAVTVIIHVTWDIPQAPYVAMQGRLFIPVGPLVGLALGRAGSLFPRLAPKPFALAPLVVAAAVPILLTGTLVRVHTRYYVDTPVEAAERYYKRGDSLLRAGHEECARAEFEKAIELDPENPGARFRLGAMLAKTRPDEAEAHFRAVLRRAPRHLMTLLGLGTLLNDRFEFDEGIRVLEEALRIPPEKENDKQTLKLVRESLATARRQRDAIQAHLDNVSNIFQALLRFDALEPRHRGTPQEGWYLKDHRGPVLKPNGDGPAFPGPGFVWRCPPPSAEEIRLAPQDAEATGGRRRAPFFACGASQLGTKRVFVFPPPTNAVLLDDDAVSWYFQVPLTALNDEERRREDEYRKAAGLHFPRTDLLK